MLPEVVHRVEGDSKDGWVLDSRHVFPLDGDREGDTHFIAESGEDCGR